jgi:deoxyribose-phosphate aldolase
MTDIFEIQDLIHLIDTSCLWPETDEALIRQTCKEAVQYGYATVFAMSSWLPLLANLLEGSPVKVGASIGFPLGSHSTAVKVFEVRDAIASGAQEIDIQMNVGALKSQYYDLVKHDIREVVGVSQGRLTKLILETSLLTDEEKKIACELADEAGVDFVKTSSGFTASGATVADVRLMRASVSDRVSVKASGGIKSLDQILELKQAGATRFGIRTSNALRIAREVTAL